VYDPSRVLEMNEAQIKDNFSFEAQPGIIKDRQIKQLRGKAINMVEMLWDDRSCNSTRRIKKEIR